MTLHSDQIQADLTPERQAQFFERLDQLEQAFDFGRLYTTEQMQSLLKVDDELLGIARGMPEVIERFQAKFPPDLLDAPELRRDLAALDFTRLLLARLAVFVKKVEHTQAALGHDIDAQILELYDFANQNKDRNPELYQLTQPLRDYFRKSRGKRRKPAPEPPASA